MFLNKETIVKLVDTVQAAAREFKDGKVIYKPEGSDLSVYKLITTIQTGAYLYANNVRICFIEQSALDSEAIDGIKYAIESHLVTKATGQAVDFVNEAFSSINKDGPFHFSTVGYDVTVLPMADNRFVQIKLMRGENIILLHTVASAKEHQAAVEDIEEMLTRLVTAKIMSGEIELIL